MFKKVLYAGAIVCTMAALASCGNKQNEETLPEGDTAVVGEVVTEVVQDSDSVAVATAAVVDTITPADAAAVPAEKAK